MQIKRSVLIWLVWLILQSNGYYLLELNRNHSSIESYCSIEYFDGVSYQIPRQCHRHVQCASSNCDDRQFHCVKLRETLCCLYDFVRSTCVNRNVNERFRSVYFHVSIQYGFCEINLERIEQQDRTYCLNNYVETSVRSVVYEIQSKSRMISVPYQFFIICFMIVLIL